MSDTPGGRGSGGSDRRSRPRRPERGSRRLGLFALVLLTACGSGAESATAQGTPPYTRADSLRGANTPERAWWDVTFYDLSVRLDPADRSIRGRVGIVYRVVGEPREMQIDLQPPLVADSVVQDGRRLEIRRDSAAFWVTPEVGDETLDTVTVHYHGRPRSAPNPPWDGGFVWAADSLGTPWIGTANQGLGASVWWPNKDTQREEPDSQRIAVTVPDELVEVSNGRLRSVRPNDDGTTTYEWFVRAPINNYNVTVNAGDYTHQAGVFHGEEGVLTLDYWPLAHRADAAREQFAQVPSVLTCFEGWFGPFPWYEDGFTLVETPYLGMEHQSAIAYGNRYMEGYLGNDLSGTGLGMEWDYIIVHETAHEWWGNNITTEDLADLWVHEAFGTYAEGLYTECLSGKQDGARYLRGLRGGVVHDAPIIPEYGVNAEGSGDMYMKGANMLHTIRRVVDDDARWREILRGLNRDFRHDVVTGDQVRAYMSQEAGVDLEPVFRQYLTTPDLPVLDVREYEAGGVEYRWSDVVEGFDMPVDVHLDEGSDGAGGTGACRRIHPTLDWQVLEGPTDPGAMEVDRDFYVEVRRIEGGEPTTSPPRGVC